DLAALQAQVAQARAQGWIWVENEGGDGLSALAVAGHAGGAPLALSVAGPTDRLRPQRQALLAALQEVQALVFRPRSGSEPGAA
ncbi:IclR family transcriptional regulator, partial [Verminephrobacter sp. Larva24]